MDRNNAIRTINKAYDRLMDKLDQRTSGDFDRYVAQCRIEEKEHRGSSNDNALTLALATKLFVVYTIAIYLNGDKQPQARDFFHIKTSHFMAAALVEEYREHIELAFDGFELSELVALDYAALNAV